jgi:phenylalanyl-tRNA synthetase beta chain
MRVPLRWLREYVAIEAPTADLAHRLTSAGVEVGRIDTVGAWRGVLVGRVTDLAPHGRNPAWQVAEVDVADRRARVVTAATNLRVDDRVPLAVAGATLPAGPVESKRFDGVESEGMLCSGAELGISDDRGGIYVLGEEAPVGADLAELLADEVFDIEVTPNRPDLLGVLGVAREVAVLYGLELRPPPIVIPSGPVPVEQVVSVRIEAPDLCPRYTAAVVQGLRVGASPSWLQRRLFLAGMRAISNVVDVTNYVMLELGQPLHAFDADRLRGGICVRRARAGERITTIDAAVRELAPDMLAITDESGPIAVAGVMGGYNSEVGDDTRRIVIESAHFDPRSVRRTARALRLPSEASRRFERGVDPEGTARAADRAAALIVELAGGEAAAGHLDVDVAPRAPREIALRPADVSDILGHTYSAETIASTLRPLGFDVTPADGVLQVRVPSFRRDVEGRADLAEEVARIHGYDAIPTKLPAGPLPPPDLDPTRARADVARRTLVACGYQEVITYSLVDGGQLRRLDSGAEWSGAGTTGDERMIQLHNYMSVDRAYLRTTLLGSLLETLAANLRNRERVYLFELARVYLPPLAPLPTELTRVGIVFTGPREPTAWNTPAVAGDFFDLKGSVEALLAGLRVRGVRFVGAPHASFHPGRSAALEIGDEDATQRLGVFGQIHPLVAERFDLGKREVYAAELELDALVRWAGENPASTPLPRFPGVAVDLAVVVDEDVRETDVAAAIRAAGAPLLAELRLLSVYQGPPVPEGRKSLAYALVFRAPDRTLTDEDAAPVQAAIEAMLRDRFAGVIRGR